MAIYVYDIATGALNSWCPEDDGQVADSETLAAKGLAVASGLDPLSDTKRWDETTRTVVAFAPDPAPKLIGTGRWLMRFSPAEFQAIRASEDTQVQQILFALDHTVEINLVDPMITGSVAYLVFVGLIDESRVGAILQ